MVATVATVKLGLEEKTVRMDVTVKIAVMEKMVRTVTV
jgi:hypothetical protein